MIIKAPDRDAEVKLHYEYSGGSKQSGNISIVDLATATAEQTQAYHQGIAARKKARKKEQEERLRKEIEQREERLEKEREQREEREKQLREQREKREAWVKQRKRKKQARAMSASCCCLVLVTGIVFGVLFLLGFFDPPPPPPAPPPPVFGCMNTSSFNFDSSATAQNSTVICTVAVDIGLDVDVRSVSTDFELRVAADLKAYMRSLATNSTGRRILSPSQDDETIATISVRGTVLNTTVVVVEMQERTAITLGAANTSTVKLANAAVNSVSAVLSPSQVTTFKWERWDYPRCPFINCTSPSIQQSRSIRCYDSNANPAMFARSCGDVEPWLKEWVDTVRTCTPSRSCDIFHDPSSAPEPEPEFVNIDPDGDPEGGIGFGWIVVIILECCLCTKIGVTHKDSNQKKEAGIVCCRICLAQAPWIILGSTCV